ncbi:hypothetical protein [Aliivibrio sp. 1S128]|uniref:hypothetical protein n=1 Tax=Aliivibrio sp. 1S128 TaxID=1840085 RepID=UPI00080E1BA9|nr:hypothetical protein [Aliivibrio sp. 1S128]OCH24630.1 hypothetical protein A6E03_19175 [Aliivibrio sp. 1S128]
MRFSILVMLLISFKSLALDDYKCMITNAVSSNENGKLIEVGDKSVNGKIFTVDRSSGVMVGPIKNNYISEPIVLDFGSTDNSFKAVTTMRNEITTNVYVLTIQEFIDGSRKPFVFLSNSDVFYGYCEHF